MPAETHVERNPIGPDDVLAIIRDRLAEILEVDEDRITRESRFAEDLENHLFRIERNDLIGQAAVSGRVVMRAEDAVQPIDGESGDRDDDHGN